jgi:hypothetical protein
MAAHYFTDKHDNSKAATKKTNEAILYQRLVWLLVVTG